MTIIRCVLLAALLANATAIGAAQAGPTAPSSLSAPEWLRDLVIYEIATKAFTSPRGPETGTFASVEEKLPYLQQLGITGIWLTGYSVSDPHHFFNIWSQYAVIEPDELDPSLGTAQQFKSMIEGAHRRGIRVFLDVITHGVMAESSLVRRHPQWFRGGSWGMLDYDWRGGHTDLDDWWVTLWTRYVIGDGVDGFRLDSDIERPDLWARVRQNAANAGHPIAIFTEDSYLIPGVTDFEQGTNRISVDWTNRHNPALASNVPGFYRRLFQEPGSYRVEVQHTDGSRDEGRTGSDSRLRVQVKGFTANRVALQQYAPAGLSELYLSVSNVNGAPIQNIVVTRLDGAGERSPTAPKQWLYRVPSGTPKNPLKLERHGDVLDLYLAVHGYSPSVQLSCHDNGWSDPGFSGAAFPLDKNPYVARGSRSIFGYSFLLTPMIPLFMAGEEFDAVFHALPALSTDLYGGAHLGKGHWLYGAQLNWAELEQPAHQAMLEDVKRMLAIRAHERAVLGAEVNPEVEPRLTAVPYKSDISVPAPYMRWSGRTAIVIAGNRNSQRDAHLEIRIPLDWVQPELRSHETFQVTDLWNGGAAKVYSLEQLSGLRLTVPRDHTPRGGLAVLKLQQIE